MLKSFFDDGTVVQPEELQILQEVFDAVAAARGLPPGGAERAELAAFIVSLFKGGFRAKDELMHVLQEPAPVQIHTGDD